VADSDYRHLAEFRRELREFLHFSETAARAARLQPQQHQALLAIRGFSRDRSMPVGELAAHLKVRHHSAVGMIARMMEKGLVTKATDPLDRRRVLVRLTQRGELSLEKLSAAHKDELKRVGPALRRILTHLDSRA
jgi:DNA-binding MarR family transcriptional regulator